MMADDSTAWLIHAEIICDCKTMNVIVYIYDAYNESHIVQLFHSYLHGMKISIAMFKNSMFVQMLSC